MKVKVATLVSLAAATTSSAAATSSARGLSNSRCFPVRAARAAFVALASAPTVPERIANLYERLARGDKGRLSKQEISARLRKAGPSGFDPLPYLKQMTMPGLWLFGTADDRTPVPESVAILNALKADGHDITIHVFPNAGHGLLDVPPTDPDAAPTLIAWVRGRVHVTAA